MFQKVTHVPSTRLPALALTIKRPILAHLVESVEFPGHLVWIFQSIDGAVLEEYDAKHIVPNRTKWREAKRRRK